MPGVDPARISPLVRRMILRIEAKFVALKASIREFIVEENELDLVTNDKRFQFLTSKGKVDAFREWLKDQVRRGLLQVEGGEDGKPWTAEYVTSAYKQGLLRGYTDVNALPFGDRGDFEKGKRAEFLNSAFGAPETIQKIELISTRTFTDLEGVSAAMDTQMTRVLSEAVANGWDTEKTAAELLGRVDHIGVYRATLVARTELAYAHAEGQLDSFEKLGVEELNVDIEWKTAADPCPLCAARRGVYKISEARGLIPFHPNCRCAWVPVVRF